MSREQRRDLIRLASLALAAISPPVLIVVGGTLGKVLFAASLIVLAIAVGTSPSSFRSFLQAMRLPAALGVLSIVGILTATFVPGVPEAGRHVLATAVFGLVIAFLASLMVKTVLMFRTARSRH